ncbi:hypothetical protein ACFY3U_27395 [Micromonospora sp. NPDC000089]|uniref:hypothetical protein n=1 Tax=unclassified Micromonospora TaxID=2617518 RepID=UPI0036C38FD9
MPPAAAHRIPYRRSAVAAVLLAAVPIVTACGAPPERRPAAVPPATTAAPLPPTPTPPGPTALLPGPGSTPATDAPTLGTPPTLAAPTLGAPPTMAAPPPATPGAAPVPGAAAPCGGRPDADRVTALLRDRVLPPGVTVRATTGPLCADGWQYTILAVSGHEELQVVTRGRPGALTLVTAGTDVCSIEVRAAAPLAVQALACDGGTEP